MSVLAYAGLRPHEALALQWRHVPDPTPLIEQAVSDDELKGQKTGRPPRSVKLLAPVRHDLKKWQLHEGRPSGDAPIFPSAAGTFWREHDWRN